MNKDNNKELYVAPRSEAVDIQAESIICQSFGTDDLPGFEF